MYRKLLEKTERDELSEFVYPGTSPVPGLLASVSLRKEFGLILLLNVKCVFKPNLTLWGELYSVSFPLFWCWFLMSLGERRGYFLKRSDL